MEEVNSEIKAFVAEHPRMMGVLFTLVLLLSQVTTVAAGQSGGTVVGS